MTSPKVPWKNLDHAFPPFVPGVPLRSVYERAGFEVNPEFSSDTKSLRSTRSKNRSTSRLASRPSTPLLVVSSASSALSDNINNNKNQVLKSPSLSSSVPNLSQTYPSSDAFSSNTSLAPAGDLQHKSDTAKSPTTDSFKNTLNPNRSTSPYQQGIANNSPPVKSDPSLKTTLSNIAPFPSYEVVKQQYPEKPSISTSKFITSIPPPPPSSSLPLSTLKTSSSLHRDDKNSFTAPLRNTTESTTETVFSSSSTSSLKTSASLATPSSHFPTTGKFPDSEIISKTVELIPEATAPSIANKSNHAIDFPLDVDHGYPAKNKAEQQSETSTLKAAPPFATESLNSNISELSKNLVQASTSSSFSSTSTSTASTAFSFANGSSHTSSSSSTSFADNKVSPIGLSSELNIDEDFPKIARVSTSSSIYTTDLDPIKDSTSPRYDKTKSLLPYQKAQLMDNSVNNNHNNGFNSRGGIQRPNPPMPINLSKTIPSLSSSSITTTTAAIVPDEKISLTRTSPRTPLQPEIKSPVEEWTPISDQQKQQEQLYQQLFEKSDSIASTTSNNVVDFKYNNNNNNNNNSNSGFYMNNNRNNSEISTQSYDSGTTTINQQPKQISLSSSSLSSSSLSQKQQPSVSRSSSTTSRNSSLFSGQSQTSSPTTPDNIINSNLRPPSKFPAPRILSDEKDKTNNRKSRLIMMASPPPSATSSTSSSSSSSSSTTGVTSSSSGNSKSKSRAHKKGPCRGCGQIITGKYVASKDGKLSGCWHKDCFSCTDCGTQDFSERPENYNSADNQLMTADSSEFYILNDLPYCYYCYHSENNSFCRACNLGIEGACVDDGQYKYHSHCCP